MVLVTDENENPLAAAQARADEMGLEGEDRDDFILAKMQRAGYKKGPGEWVRPEDDDEPQDDDDEPVTRADIRRMNRERQKATLSPPRKTNKDDDDGKSGKPVKTRKPGKSGNTNAWW
jgi:hypothetical protein